MHQPAITPSKLKIVVLLDSSTMPAWVHRALTDIETSEFAVTALRILGARRRGNRVVLLDLCCSLTAGLLTLYRRFDRAMYEHSLDAFAPVGALENAQGKEILRAVLANDGVSDRFEPEDLTDWLPGVMGTHTYDRTGEFEVVDLRRPLSRLGGRDS